MKKLHLFWISALLLMLAACNSDDETENSSLNNLYGYWENADPRVALYDGRYGFHFKEGGKIASWSLQQGEYNEGDWGLFWQENEEMHIKYGSKEPIFDELYYKIERLTASELVVREYGGIAGLPYEEGRDVTYKKLTGKPNP